MSASAPALIRSWRVGERVATLTVPRLSGGGFGAATIEWAPAIPDHLTREELRQYKRGRDKALLTLAEAHGLRIALVEVQS